MDINFGMALKNGAKEGYCRICGKYGKLSSDHIPPKSCGNKNKVTVRIDDNKFVSQNGFNCKTICEKCNNDLLGANLDKEYKKLYERIIEYKRSNLVLPNNRFRMTIDIKNILRCLIGHMLASTIIGQDSVEEILKRPNNKGYFICNEYRKFVIGEIDHLEDVDIYYWYYPYNEIVLSSLISKNINFLDKRIPTIDGSVIKIFPIAFYIVKHNDNVNFPYFSKYNFNMNEMEINVDKSLASKSRYFPEHVNTICGIVLYGNNSVINVER